MTQSTGTGRAVSRFDVIAARLPASRTPNGGPSAEPAAAASSWVATDRALSCEREQPYEYQLWSSWYKFSACLKLDADHMWYFWYEVRRRLAKGLLDGPSIRR